ncbi:hypothetical protein [Gordonia terrae]|uniref:hypothetical protein n=1 Tax=Gordonia terrae TaxID=2055 RepID=UPI0011800232|nr:hypothetical protein [Gordonia terrae]
MAPNQVASILLRQQLATRSASLTLGDAYFAATSSLHSIDTPRQGEWAADIRKSTTTRHPEKSL